LIRSAIEGQANAILVKPDVQASDHRVSTLNPRRFRNREADRLELGFRVRVAWAKERRVCHAVRVTLDSERAAVVANLHATAFPRDKRLADAELLRAAAFADGLARRGDRVILGGDFNVTVVSSPTLRSLATQEWGFSAAGPGIDHVLVRGFDVVEPERRWDDARRRADGALMSDHAPVDVVVR